MKQLFLLIICVLSQHLFAQDNQASTLLLKDSVSTQITLKGHLKPAKDYSWVILYRIVGAQQRYVENTQLKAGEFSINMPENATEGMYRLTYDLNNNGYVDFIYNKKDISLVFNPENPGNSLKFIISEENKNFKSYLADITRNQNELDSLQFTYFNSTDKKIAEKHYLVAYSNLQKTQANYATKSSGTVSESFIYSLQKYNPPVIIETAQEYLNSTKDHFFDFIDFKNPMLINSTILTKKVVNYVYYLNSSEDYQIQQALYKKAMIEVFDLIKEQPMLRAELLTTLMYGFVEMENLPLVDYLMEHYYRKLPETAQDKEVIDDIALQTKTAIGRIAPDFNYDTGKTLERFYAIETTGEIVLVFWSTSCSHCLKEIPKLHAYSKLHPSLKVVAVALEKDELGFNYYKKGLENFTNILALDKWKNPIARLYNINTTPNYLILNRDKKIIAKPYDLEELSAYLDGLPKK
ncbi:MAG: thioredoxin family protein [Flavobacteriaceae bacterium]|nr:thioredoxin family protein [Flavobacteriaceae bacterium]